MHICVSCMTAIADPKMPPGMIRRLSSAVGVLHQYFCSSKGADCEYAMCLTAEITKITESK